MVVGGNLLTFFILENILVFPVDTHAPPALLSILLVLKHEVGTKVLDALPLPADGDGVDHGEGVVVPEVEVLAMPWLWEVAVRSCN